MGLYPNIPKLRDVDRLCFPRMKSHFELLAEASPSFCPSVKLYKWKSSRTGLQSVLIKRQSPSVQGYFAVASESNDDSGCPHTLEHIVFMGSKKYPYKGLLDKLSATQMSSTNAWTSQDQTCYTLNTAGDEGFLNLLPVYLDHILNATVTDAACTTEVYHIDGKGEEKGVVFSEMQGHEHTSDSLMTVEAQKMLFAERSGYATNTGGCLSALRVLRPETIKQYHKYVYRPSNLSVIVAGDVNPQSFISTLEMFDEEYSQKHPQNSQESHPRPFVESPLSSAASPLKTTTFHTIEFPDSMESSGEVLISWLGPSVTDLQANTALQVVTTYLWMQNSGKLEVEFVNVSKDKALAAEVVGYTNEYLNTQVCLSLYGVPIPNLEKSASTVVDYLEKRLLNELDFTFLKQCIDTVYDGFVLMAEEQISTFVSLAISDFLYGNGNSFESWVSKVDEFLIIREWTEADWRKFIRTHVVASPKACVLGRPSRDAYVRIDEEKKARSDEINQTRDLQECDKLLQKALIENERVIPEELLSMFKIPDVARIRFITSLSAATTQMIKHGLPGAALQIDETTQSYLANETCQLALNFESIPSQFVAINLFITASSVDKELLPLISVVLANAFASPMVLDDGRVLSPEEVAQESQQDLLGSGLCVNSSMQEMVSITAKAKLSNYSKAVEWIKRCMFNVVFDVEQTSICIARHLKTIPEAKRSDTDLLQASMDEVLLTDRSLRRQSGSLNSEHAVREFETDLDGTVEKLHKLRSQLFQLENIRGLIIGNVAEISKANGISILRPWIELEKKCLEAGSKTDINNILPVRIPNHYLSQRGQSPGLQAILTLCAASDSTNLNVIAKGPNSYGHEDLPALSVVNTFLDMAEGPFWTAVRGSGYAYGAALSTSVQMGHVVLSIYSAADGLSALKACKEVVLDVLARKIPVNETILESVVATIVGDLAGHLAEPATAIEEKFNDTVLKGYEPNYVQTVIREIKAVTPERFMKILKAYALPLFEPQNSSIFCVASPSEEFTLKDGLVKLGYGVEVHENEAEYSDAFEGSSSESEGEFEN